MELTSQFIKLFGIGLFYTAPVLTFLLSLIVLLGQFIGKLESWSKLDALYFCLITATTVGYGDFRPHSTKGKFLAISIAFLGLLLTGIIVAVGVKAASVAFHEFYTVTISKK